MSAPILVDITDLKAELERAIETARSLAETHREYAEQYAYDALIKHGPPSASPELAERTMKLAFWHDGLRDGYESSLYTLTSLQKALLTAEEKVKEQAKAVAAMAAKPNDDVPF